VGQVEAPASTSKVLGGTVLKRHKLPNQLQAKHPLQRALEAVVLAANPPAVQVKFTV